MKLMCTLMTGPAAILALSVSAQLGAPAALATTIGAATWALCAMGMHHKVCSMSRRG